MTSNLDSSAALSTTLPWAVDSPSLVAHGDNFSVLKMLPDESFRMIYIDPPFNTGRVQTRQTIKTVRSETGSRIGFKGQSYDTVKGVAYGYDDSFEDYWEFLEPRLEEAWRLLADDGTLYLHLDYREVHYAKVLLDALFGRECFLNEIIWAYDYGAKSKSRWAAKHDNILVYVKNPKTYFFNSAAVDREPYMAPGMVTPEKAALGKLPTDCYSADTDILTDRGWINFADLTESDLVATVSPEAEMSFAPTSKLHAYHYKGEMVEFKSKTVNMLVTPNHKMYLKPKRAKEFEFIEAGAILDDKDNKHHYYSLLNQMSWEGNYSGERYSVPECHYERPASARPLPDFDMGDWCEFLGWFLSEGSTVVYRDRKEVMITKILKDQVPQISALLDRMHLNYRYDGINFIIHNKQLTLHLRELGKAYEKYIPREIMALPPVYLERLYGSLMRGDGHVKKNPFSEDHSYVTTSPRLASDVQELMIKLGYAASVNKRTMDPSKPNWRQSYSVQRRTAKESTLWNSRHVNAVDYDGMVYCCTVEPHHTLVVRRGGRPAVAGNCWWHTIVSPMGKEKTGYPTQKPEGILRRVIQASSEEGDWVLDFFAGSGTTAAVAAKLGRKFVTVDQNPDSIKVIRERLGKIESAADTRYVSVAESGLVHLP